MENVLFLWLAQACSRPHYEATAGTLIYTCLTVNDFLLAVPHHMNVFNADELQFNIGVVILILIAFTRCSICHRVQLDTHIHTRYWIYLYEKGLVFSLIFVFLHCF